MPTSRLSLLELSLSSLLTSPHSSSSAWDAVHSSSSLPSAWPSVPSSSVSTSTSRTRLLLMSPTSAGCRYSLFVASSSSSPSVSVPSRGCSSGKWSHDRLSATHLLSAACLTGLEPSSLLSSSAISPP